MNFTFPVFISLVTFFAAKSSDAQSSREDSLLKKASYEKTVAVYYIQIDDQSALYNGKLYSGYDFTFRTGSPYFQTSKFTPGSLVYDRIFFDSISLLYDDMQQSLVLNKSNYPIQLIPERVSSFTINGSAFVRLEADSAHKGIPRTGFYQILYPGRSRILKWTSKQIREEASSTEGLLKHVEEKDYYFMRIGNAYKKITSKGEYLDLMNDYKKEVQRYMRKNKLNFRTDKDQTIIQATAYYDQLTK